MSTEEVLQRVMDAPAPAALAVAAVVLGALLLLAGGLLGFSRWRGLGLGLGTVSLFGAIVVLALVDAQTDITREGPNITVTRSRFTPRQRAAARAGLIALPVATTLSALALWAAHLRRLRSRVPGLIKSGRAHLQQGHHAPALADFEQAIQIAPHLGEAYSGRGSALYAMGDAQRALADFDRALQYDPRQALAYLHRGKIHIETGAFDAALEDFNRLLSLRGPDAEIHLHRGICLHGQGRSDEAVLDFQRVLKLTNHSDFAEPAREWLHRLAPAPDRPSGDPLSGTNSRPIAGPGVPGHGHPADGPRPA